MNFTEKQILEKTGLHVGRLGSDVDICMTGPGSLAHRPTSKKAEEGITEVISQWPKWNTE